MRFSFPVSLALLAPFAAAQGSVVTPSHFTNAEAPSNGVFFSGAGPSRYLQINDELKGNPRFFKGISFRRDYVFASQNQSIMIDVWCSTAASGRTSTNPSATFDNNHGGNKVQVITNKHVTCPANPLDRVPADFAFDLPFDIGYAFDGLGPLCLELQTTLLVGGISLDADEYLSASAIRNPPLVFQTYGFGCYYKDSPFSKMAIGSSIHDTTVNWPAGTGSIRVYGSNAPPNSVVFMLLGFSNRLAFGTLPLPFLLPGSSGAPSGPCILYTDIALIQPSATNSRGEATTDFAFPATAALNGVRTFEQMLVLDQAANPSGVALSNYICHNLVAPYGMTPGARVSLFGSLGPVGAAKTNSMLVIRFNF